MPLPRNKLSLVNKPKNTAPAAPPTPGPLPPPQPVPVAAPVRPPLSFMRELAKIDGKFVTKESHEIGKERLIKSLKAHVRKELGPHATEEDVLLGVLKMVTPENLRAFAENIGLGTHFNIVEVPEGIASPSNATGMAQVYWKEEDQTDSRPVIAKKPSNHKDKCGGRVETKQRTGPGGRPGK